MELREVMNYFSNYHPLQKPCDEFIRDYETRKYVIESNNNNLFEKLTIDYSLTLAENEEYKRAIPLLKKSIDLIESENFENKIFDSETYIKQLYFFKGKSHYFTRNLKEAKVIFLKLHKKYPNNDIYKDWLKQSITYRYESINNFFWAVAGFSLILHLALRFFSNTKFDMIVFGIGALSAFLTLIVKIIIYYEKKKVK